MSGNQWENLPEPLPERPLTGTDRSWQGFTADPRLPANQQLRASDADRDYATRLIEQARADGRLTPAEQADRSAVAGGARTLGELAPLIGDLMPAAHPADHGAAERARVRSGALRGWLGLAVLLNVIWVMTCLTTGRLLYYWPMWPMAGTAIPLFFTLMATDGWPGRRPEQRAPRQLPPGNDLR